MKFRLIWVGSNADAEFGAAIERYLSRIKHFFAVEIIEIDPGKRGRQSEKDGSIIRDHSARLVAAIPSRGYTVVLDERGRSMDSLIFAKWLQQFPPVPPPPVPVVFGRDLRFLHSQRCAAHSRHSRP